MADAQLSSLLAEDVLEKEQVYNVAGYIARLNQAIKPLKAVIQGEVGQVTDRGGKPIYFKLRDKEGGAVLECLIWRDKLQGIGVELKEGMEIKVQGYAEIYPPMGRITLMALYVVPIGEGALKLAYEKLKRELDLAGFFREDRKRSRPQFVQRIGLITSNTAAAKKDFLTHLGNHGITVYFIDVRVEGVKAVGSIVDAIRWFNENTDDVELLVITRGGGSLESLQAFNTLEIAKAIYSSKIPIMSAVGHEQDVTIADLVADVRASVPTHAGKLLGDPWEAVKAKVDAIERHVGALFRNRLKDIDGRLLASGNNFVGYYSKYLAQCSRDLEERQKSMVRRYGEVVVRSVRDLEMYQSSLMRCFKDVLGAIKKTEYDFVFNYERFSRRLVVIRQTVVQNEGRVGKVALSWYSGLTTRVDNYDRLLLASDPQLKLKQGFSIVRTQSGKIIKSGRELQVNAIIASQLADGVIDAEVTNIY